MVATPGTLNQKDVRRRFDSAAAGFGDASFVHRTTFEGLVERMAPVVISPSLILDLGSASGRGSREIAKQFKKGRVISLDLSGGMLQMAKQKKSFFSTLRELQGDATRMPLRTGSIDLIIANQLLPWVNDLPACFAEIARVLTKGGLFAFATLGPDSFCELRAAWAESDAEPHVNTFPDMHDVGDALVRAGLVEPILDVDYLTVTYPDKCALYKDLAACGARNSLAGRRRSLTGKQRFARMEAELAARHKGSCLPVTLELVYGHAWGSGPQTPHGEFHLEPGAITHRRRD
jgi:malonyl-CoA O-methyltransferase